MKTTIIIPSGPSPQQTFVRSILSLLMRSDLSRIDKIIVSINGPDSRSKPTYSQDKKEEFCKLLKNDGFPVEVVRSWSRVGFGQPIQLALPLVSTETYVTMQDDVLIMDNRWQTELEDAFNNGFSAIISKPVLTRKLTTTIYDANRNTTIVYLPSINTAFSAFSKSANVNWSEYFCRASCDNVSINAFFLRHPNACTLLAGEGFQSNLLKKTRMSFPDPNISFIPEVVHYGLGCWFVSDVLDDKYKISTFSSTPHHLEAMSWKPTAEWESQNPDLYVREFVKQAKDSSFGKYLESLDNPPDICDVKPLVCVIVYNRQDTITHWLRAWTQAKRFNGKLMVVQNYDDTDDCKALASLIQSFHPDYHWIRPNDGDSALYWFELADGRHSIDYDWNVLVAMTDDCLPIRKDFLWPLLSQFSNPKLGLTGGWTGEKQRGVCLAMRRQALVDVSAMIDPYAMKEARQSQFSMVMEDDIKKHIAKCGYECTSSKYEWPLIFGWDCDHQGINDLWEKAEANFHEGKSEEYHL